MSKKAKKITENKLYHNLLRLTQQFMEGKGYKPMTVEQLLTRLGLPEQHSPLLKQIIQHLIQEGNVEVSHGLLLWKEEQVPTVTGIISMHPRGFGFVRAEDSTLYPEDIFIPKPFTMNAVNGDTVEVLINTEAVSEKGPEGRVVSIMTRGRTHIAGTILEAEPYGDIIAYVPMLGTSQRVLVEHTTERSLIAGDRIVMEVVDWGSKETETICRFSHYIGHISDPSCDINAAIEEYELRNDFPKKVVQEAAKWGKQVSRKDIQGREDLRDVTCITIDPDTAKDFDDALSLKKDKKGHYHLGVHIADVSHYVPIGSALDKEARLRCNSTYFPGKCVPMLPSVLSDNLCSLKPDVNRLAASILMRFDSEGNLIDYRITRSVIKSAKRFTYKKAKEVLDGKVKSPHKSLLKLMVELCALLKKKRYERGSIEFAMQDLIVLVDEKGVPTKMEVVAYDITHQLVEEFMLKANEMVATHLTNQGKNLTYRVHEEPAAENLRDFALMAGAFGFKLPESPTPQDFQEMFEEALKTPYGQYLATAYIRKMRLAVYSPDNIGHYGLGLTHYCHFTSPIRRYVDLVVHRILFGHSDDRESLEVIAADCSEQERISSKAEMSVVILKKLRLLESIQEKEPRRQYEAVVTRVKPFGIFIEIVDYMIESFLHVSELQNDYFEYSESKGMLIGVNYGQSYHSGDKLTVMLKNVNFVTLESQWSLVWSGKKEGKRAPVSKRMRKERSEKKSKKTKWRKRR